MTLIRYGKDDVRVSSQHGISYTLWEREELHQTIRYWYSQGLSDLQVAVHAGCSDQTVWRYRKRKGLVANNPQKPHSKKGN